MQTRRAILLTFAVFALHPIALGGWLAFIPLVKESLGLSKSAFAISLLGLPLATVPSLQIASRVISRFGPRRVMAVVFPLQGLTVLLPLLARSQGELFLALMTFGVTMAFLQVCLNVYAGRLEKQLGVLVMSRCHGLWALGLMCGPLIMTWLNDMSPLAALAMSAWISSVIAAVCALMLPKLEGGEGAAAPPRRKISDLPRALAAISLFVLSIAMLEGAMADWAAIYMSERLEAGSAYIGLSISLFAGALAAGRLSGDWLKARMGAVRLARATVAIGVVGLMCLALPFPVPIAFLGFGLIGAGASVGFPLGVSAVAALSNRYEGANIAIMSSVSICGFLIGPPMIGFLADAYTLSIGLAALIPGLLVSFVLARSLRAQE